MNRLVEYIYLLIKAKIGFRKSSLITKKHNWMLKTKFKGPSHTWFHKELKGRLISKSCILFVESALIK